MSKKLEEKCLFCKYHRQEKTVDGTRDIHYCDKGTSPLYHGSYLQKEEIIRGCKNFKRNNCVIVDKKVLERLEKVEKAWEIVVSKGVNVGKLVAFDIFRKTFSYKDYVDYWEKWNGLDFKKISVELLTEAEFNLLKEML